MPPTSAAPRTRRSARRPRRSDPTQPKGIGVTDVGTMKQLLVQLRADLQGGQWVDPAALDMLALGALIEGKPGTAQVLATLANGRRLDDLLAELEEA